MGEWVVRRVKKGGNWGGSLSVVGGGWREGEEGDEDEEAFGGSGEGDGNRGGVFGDGCGWDMVGSWVYV